MGVYEFNFIFFHHILQPMECCAITLCRWLQCAQYISLLGGGARNKKAFMGATPPKTHTKRTSSPLLAMFVVDSFKFSSDLYAGYILLLEPFFTYSNQIEWSRHSPMWTLHLFLCVHSTPSLYVSLHSLSFNLFFLFGAIALCPNTIHF